MAGWHHRLNGQQFEQTQGDSEGQGSLHGIYTFIPCGKDRVVKRKSLICWSLDSSGQTQERRDGQVDRQISDRQMEKNTMTVAESDMTQ